ncbi:hypothetical protein BD780_002895 [Clostridium tetanomorphum]|nr:hypothetical protein [Clostridium tetanomorphum]NRS85670.1 hypothetical protein [Clostridium tetanomorphum]NRZ96319.1 hypothetical protein [Clostridium tetanomorphum]SQC02604.1 Uncharacterised protein [Clostridium tetanomorphum]
MIKISRKRGYADKLRKYKVILDNNYLKYYGIIEINYLKFIYRLRGGSKWKRNSISAQNAVTWNMKLTNFRQLVGILQRYLIYKIKNLLLSAVKDVGTQNCTKQSLPTDGIYWISL